MKGSLLEETFELVRSLTKAEKRYFKLHSQFHRGNKTYLKLFDIIDLQKTFDEKRIVQKFLANNKCTNFPAVKKYLFDQLVASLKSYGAYKDRDSDHTDLIETYKVLHYKGLHGQSGRLLNKIKKVTLEDDAFIRHFYVLLMEYLREMFNADDSASSRVHQILEEKKHTFRIIENYTKVGDLFSYQRLYLRKKLYCRTKKEKEELTILMNPVLKTKESDMLSRTALAMRKLGLCDYYMAIGKPQKAFEISKMHLELSLKEGNADKIDTTTISEYQQHMWLALSNGIYEGFEENMRKFKSMIDTVHNQQKFAMGYERWYNYFLIYYIRRNQYSKALGFIESEKSVMNKIGRDLSMKSRITLWYFTAYLHYLLKEYRPALKIIQKIMNSKSDEMEEYSFARLLLLFIHYDLKNYELLEYQVRSYHRLMQKTERMYKCEELIMRFFKTITESDSAQKRLEQLTALEKKVTAIFKTPYERGFAFYFDIYSWIGGNKG